MYIFKQVCNNQQGISTSWTEIFATDKIKMKELIQQTNSVSVFPYKSTDGTDGYILNILFVLQGKLITDDISLPSWYTAP